MIDKIDHLGIAVRNLEQAITFYEDVLGLRRGTVEEVKSQKVRTVFFSIGDTRIELLEPTSEDSPLARFLAKRGEGIHHIAYRTRNLEKQLKKAEDNNCRLINREPVIGAGGREVAFLHPASANGVLTEFCALAYPRETANEKKS